MIVSSVVRHGCLLLHVLSSRPPPVAVAEPPSASTNGGVPLLPNGARLSLGTLDFDDAGVGGRVWSSAPVLCEWLRDNLRPGDACLELGSGTGAVGLFAAGCGASRVVVSDGGPPALLVLLADNVRANNIRVVDVAELRWDADAVLPDGPFDWIFASDVTYDDDAHAPLADTLRALLVRAQRDGEPAPRVIIAEEHGAPLEAPATAGLFLDEAFEAFRAVAAERGLECRLPSDAGAGVADLGFNWPAEAFAEARPFCDGGSTRCFGAGRERGGETWVSRLSCVSWSSAYLG